MFANSDFNDLLRIFNARSVKYLVIGGYAVIQYTEPRFTQEGTGASTVSPLPPQMRQHRRREQIRPLHTRRIPRY